MGYFSGSVFSKALYMDTQLGVILPHDSRKQRGVSEPRPGVKLSDRPRTLILLHGLSDNYLAWMARTAVLRYAEEYDIAVIMPEVARSWYADMKFGRSYFEFITEELPEYAAKTFNISLDPEDLMIAGLSMGGYGSLKCALNYPDRYSAVGVFSSAWDIQRLLIDEDLATDDYGREDVLRDRYSIFGDAKKIPENCDIRALLRKAEIPESLKMYVACGREDFLYEDNLKLMDLMEKEGVPFVSTLMPGEHEWPVWDRALQLFLDYAVCGIKPPAEL